MNELEDNKRVVGEFFHQLINEREVAAWVRYVSEGFKHHFNIPDVAAGVPGLEKLYMGLFSAFPDLSTEIELMIAEQDYVVTRAKMSATHSGLYGEIQPTNKKISWEETIVFRLQDGAIAECFPEVRLEKLLWQISGKGEGFTAPEKSVLSSFIAFMMLGLSSIFTNGNGRNLAEVALNKSVVKRYVDEFKNQQKFMVFPKLFSKNFRHHFNFPNRSDRMDSFVSVGQTFLRAFPDVKVNLLRLLAEGDLVVEQNQVSATHKGTFKGIRATGRKVVWTETHIYRLEDGKIIENWPAVNFERILLQIS